MMRTPENLGGGQLKSSVKEMVEHWIWLSIWPVPILNTVSGWPSAPALSNIAVRIVVVSSNGELLWWLIGLIQMDHWISRYT